MRIFPILILFHLPILACGQSYQLAPPRIIVDSVFFRQSARVQIEFDLEGATIRFVADGTVPGNNAPVYQKPVVVTTSTQVFAVAQHPEFLPSQLAGQSLVRISAVPDSTWLLTAPDTLYSGQRVATLFDLKKGGHDMKNGQWLGFKTDTVVVEVRFNQPKKTKAVLVSTLFDPGAWIFPPAGIEILGAAGYQPLKPLGRWSARPDEPWKNQPVLYDLFQRVVIRPLPVDHLQIRVISHGALPEGHAGAGQPAWLFLDEIVFL